MADVTPAAIAQWEADLAILLPVIEGDEDFERLNLDTHGETSKEDVTAKLTKNKDLQAKLEAAIAAAKALADTGYPAKPVVVIPAADFADLQNQIDTLTAALAEFRPANAAVSGKITFGTPS